MADTRVKVSPSGPLLVEGSITVVHKDGDEEVKEKGCALCRCGGSSNKPFCDGTHRKIGFQDD